MPQTEINDVTYSSTTASTAIVIPDEDFALVSAVNDLTNSINELNGKL